ncbi:ligase-associated DNA damage response endonuclease PdeM [Novosphingobium sp. 9U]|uniref:ligase-associated DNA damage response endonuclease PdeM n=1 Tax=Novosphingobium sp. 9U TaxID=2653158 RepID=UPI0012F02A44|nr:ligase-associated DNA damage response endonuclease PdeM [Novosphingobium sp. 9U]VWX54508.1 Phosphoesterase [Novosphingobium sp. 9U]
MVPFSFCGEELRLVGATSSGRGGGGALYWPREQALLVADLHLEKASFYARSGQMLPPYDSRETLERLALAIRETGARRVFALGDNFHDDSGVGRLEPHAAGMLAALTRAVEWVWIVGNHDPSLEKDAGGEVVAEAAVAGLILRHKARAGETAPELSGHFHPKLVVAARGRRIARACAVASERRIILPAFGALTGGMNAASTEILAAMQPASAIDAILPARGRLLQYPLWRAAA